MDRTPGDRHSTPASDGWGGFSMQPPQSGLATQAGGGCARLCREAEVSADAPGGQGDRAWWGASSRGRETHVFQ